MSNEKENIENIMLKVRTATKKGRKVEKKKKITKQRPIIDTISKSKELSAKMKSKRCSRSKNQSAELKLCPNGKPMPTLAELEKMFEDSDEDDPTPANVSNAALCKTPEPEIKPEPTPGIVLSPKALRKISDRVLELISTLPLPDSIIIDDDNEQSSPIIPPKKAKKSGIPFIVGCKEREQIQWKSKAVVGKGDSKYGVGTKIKETDDSPEKEVEPAIPNYSNSIFNPKSAEIAAMLKKAEKEGHYSDVSTDSNKTETYDFNNSPFYNNSRGFSPLPSTSKDNETIMKNDIRFNESFTLSNTLEVSDSPIINASTNINESSNINDVEIIELPCETIILDDELITNNDYNKITSPINHSPIVVDDFYSSIIDNDHTTFIEDNDCEIVDVDAVIAENQTIIKKLKKETPVSNIINVDCTSSKHTEKTEDKENIINKSNNLIKEIVTEFFNHSDNHKSTSQNCDSLTSHENNLVSSFVNAISDFVGDTINLDESSGHNETVSLSGPPTNILNIQQHVHNTVMDDSIILISSSPDVNSTGSVNPVRGAIKRRSKKSTVNTKNKPPACIITPPQPVATPPVRNIGDCPICMDNLSSKPIASTICGHIFCMPCVQQAIKQNKRCPTCRKAIRGKGTGYHQIFL